MKVLVCGSRNWRARAVTYDALEQLKKSTKEPITIIHGDCRGADKIAGEVAETLGMEVERYPANWKKYGKSAGPIRNVEMLEQNPDKVIAFHENIMESKGTNHMLSIASKVNVPIILYTLRNIWEDFTLSSF